MKLEDVIKKMSLKGHAIFESDSKNYNLNIVGIRSADSTTNIFNDKLVVFWKYGGMNQLWFDITTDPGARVLKNPINKKGTAILVPGQYRSVYSIDLHKGKYEALCQKNGEVSVYRDADRNDILNISPDSIDTGYFGINVHGAKLGSITEFVNSWSAGCQVFKDWEQFQLFMSICKSASVVWGNKFTYTLIEE